MEEDIVLLLLNMAHFLCGETMKLDSLEIAKEASLKVHFQIENLNYSTMLKMLFVELIVPLLLLKLFPNERKIQIESVNVH